MIKPGFEPIDLVAGDSKIRELIDPLGTLPEATLRIFEDHKGPNFTREKVQIMHDSLQLGWCDLITDYRVAVNFDVITVITASRYERELHPPRHDRPKGLGLASYLIAIETAHRRGLPFISQSGGLTRQANRIWEILVSKSVAEAIETPRPTLIGRKERILAKYIARPLT